MVAHPEDPLAARTGCARVGVAFFLAGFLLARYRVVRTIGWERAVAAALTLVAVVVFRPLPAVALFGWSRRSS